MGAIRFEEEWAQQKGCLEQRFSAALEDAKHALVGVPGFLTPATKTCR
jgi:hypothetical protein